MPTEARELHLIEQALRETFAAYGYVAIEPPMVEYAEGELDPERLIQFLDRDGSLVALRPDLTTAVARLVAYRYREMTGALRLSYLAPIFREQPARTVGEREVVQAGVELIGTSGRLGDSEVLALLAESLERCGLRVDSSTIQVGHVGVVHRLFSGLPDEARADTLRALRDGDRVGALRLARAAGMRDDEAERARRTLEITGSATGKLAGSEVSELRRVVDLARERWPGSVECWGLTNLGLIPRLPYYTGIVFEALHPEVGLIASGGRYDLLSGTFGPPRPATGFAIDVLRLHRALFAQGWRPRVPQPLVALRAAGDERTVMRCAAALREAGLPVAIGPVAEAAGIPLICADVVDEGRVTLDGELIEVADLARRFAS